jgi:hypothetical protein
MKIKVYVRMYLPIGMRSGRGVMIRGGRESSINRFKTLRNDPLSPSSDIAEESVRPFLCMLSYVMLCYIMLYYLMLCYVMLCHVMLCYVMSCYVISCHVMLYYIVSCYVM